LILFFAPSLLPLAGGDSGDPDFDVVELTITECLTCGGSVDNSDGITLAPGLHTISFKVENVGTLLASCDVKIYHWSVAADPLTKTLVQQVELTPIAAGTTSSSYTLSWSAVTGTTQRISAEIISALDININNDIESFEFEVDDIGDAEVVTDDLPESGDRIAKASNTDFHVTVLNTGVVAVMARLEVTLTEVDDSTASVTFPTVAQGVQIYPGSLGNPAQGVVLTTTVVTSALVGDYIVDSKVILTGYSDGPKELPLAQINTLSISDYIAELITPANRAIEPGSTTLASFSIKNTGLSPDTYTVTVSDGQGWADTSDFTPTPLSVGPVASGGGYGYFDIPVTIPADQTLRGTSTLVTATVTSVGAETTFILTGGVTIVVGDDYKGILAEVLCLDDFSAPITPCPIFPDVTKQVEFILTNDGNSPTGFSITAGLSSPAENWDIDVLSSSIPTLNPEDIPNLLDLAETASVLIDVTPPALTNPLDPAHKLLAGSPIKMWVMVMPVEGGEPYVTTFDFIMEPTITVNPALDHSEILLTEQEVIDGVGAGGFQHVVDLDISVLHNLWTSDHLDNSINAAFTIGTVEFTPKTSGGGVYETVRWSASVSPTLTSLFPGDTTVGTLSILGPNDQMPLAGTLTIPVVSTPVENSMLAFHSTVTPKEVSHDFIVHIPEVSGVAINQPEPLDVESGTDTILTLDFENTGNDKGNYSLSIGHGIPDDWVVTFDASSGVTAGGTGGTGGTVTTVYAINDLSAEMEAHPLEDGRHQTTFDITVYASPDTLADTLQEIPIRVLNTETGLYLLDYVVTVRIQERVDMIVEAEDDGLVALSVYENPFTRIKISNTGNVLTSYHVWLDESEAGGITFSIETPEDMVIAAGFNDSIKLRLVPDSDASADIDHKVTVWVSTDTDLTAYAVITASIIADHQLSAVVDPLTYIVPGETAEVTITLVNGGNLVESVVPEVTIEDGWTVSIIPTSVTLMTGQSMDFTATVTAPPLDGTDSMQDGDMHTITVVFVDGDGTTRAIGTGTLIVSAIFDLVATEWDETAQFMFLTKHQYSPMLTNTGNTDLLVDLTYEITNPAGQPSVIWEVDGGAPSSISLPRGSAKEISFSVSQWGPDPSINDIAFLKLSIDPQDISVTGSASISSTLVMSRLFTEAYEIEASDISSSSPISQTVAWSHIPAGGSTAAEYELEYCGAQRTRPVEPDSDGQDWTFEMTSVTDTLDMDVADTACTGTRITLPSAEAYDFNSLTFKITTPVWPYIYSGDGWNLTFRLYHPNEHDDYTVYHEAVITFILKNSAELSVSNVKLTLSDNRDYLIEGTLDTGSVILRNEGTAMALLVTVTMDCGNNVIVKPRLSYPIPTMNPMDEQIHTFDLTPDRLDWWDDSSEVTCTATVESESAENDLADNVASKSGTVQSWSPNTLYVFVGLVAMIFVSLACLRLGLRNEKFKLMASYAGVITLGLAFHMGTWVWFGPVITFFVIMWMIGVAWRSGDEFQLIHEDYQRARRGQSTIYREHHAELHAVRRQLTFILSMPILGYAAIILGFPPQMEIDVTNMVTLVAMLIIPMYVIRRMLKWMDATYAELYGNLTDTEIALDRIDRELSDPARLIRRLARYGLDDEEYDEDGARAGESSGDGTGLPVPLMADEGGAAGA
jgi:uncharacterized membrane protein